MGTHAKHILEYEVDRDTLRKRLQNPYFQGYGQITKLDCPTGNPIA
jgi:hypothetical protein